MTNKLFDGAKKQSSFFNKIKAATKTPVKSIKKTVKVVPNKVVAKSVTPNPFNVAFKNSLRRSTLNHIVAAANELMEDTGEKVSILHDPDATKVALRLYQDYVSDEDMSTLPKFLMELDQLLNKHTQGKTVTEEEPEEEEPEEEDGEEVEAGDEEGEDDGEEEEAGDEEGEDGEEEVDPDFEPVEVETEEDPDDSNNTENASAKDDGVKIVSSLPAKNAVAASFLNITLGNPLIGGPVSFTTKKGTGK